MRDILTITDKAADRIKNIISEANEEIIGVKVGVDKDKISIEIS